MAFTSTAYHQVDTSTYTAINRSDVDLTPIGAEPAQSRSSDRNYVVNPSGLVYRTLNLAPTDNTQIADHWYVLTQTAAITDSSDYFTGIPTPPDPFYPHYIQLTQSQAAAQRMGLYNYPKSDLLISLGVDDYSIGNLTLTFSVNVKTSDARTLRAAIITGRGDAGNDPINDWTSTTYTPGNFFNSAVDVVAVSSLATGAGTNHVLSVTGIHDMQTMDNRFLMLMVWTDATAAQNVTLRVWGAECVAGPVRRNIPEPSIQQQYFDTDKRGLAALSGITTAADKFPYFSNTYTASTADITAGGRALVALTGAADKLPFYTASNTASTADFPSFARTLVANSTAPSARTTLGVVSASNASNFLTASVALNNSANYFTGPSVTVGANSTGTWFASGTVVATDTGTCNFYAKLWDGTTVIASCITYLPTASQWSAITLSGCITNPAGNIRISVRDATTSNGIMHFDVTGNGKDSGLTIFRVA